MRNRKKAKRGLLVILIVIVVLVAVAAAVVRPIYNHVRKIQYPLQYTEEVEKWAAEYEQDPYLFYAVIRTESGFDPNAVSSAAARGLMQMTEETFEWVKSKIAPDEDLTFDDMFVPDTSIRFGGWFLAYCMEKYGADVGTAAAAYHSGMGTVDALLEDPKYTDDGITVKDSPMRDMNHYMYKVKQAFERYHEIYTQQN